MTKEDKEQLNIEISHIFESGANHLRIFEMVENFIDKRYKAINYTHCCKSDSELLPTKQYEIEFSNHLRCGINVTNNEINVIGAIDGWGNGVGKDVITVKEL
jgi:hypothetical protein